MKQIQLQGRSIGPDAPPFIIAELSGNHNQSLDRALKLVEQAAWAGVDAIKLQTYTADTMTLDIRSGDFHIADANSLWSGKSLYELYSEASTPWEWHQPIFDYARKLGLIVFSSPFDATAVDFLESLGAPCYKIASFENTDLPLIRKAASTGKPLIISTGMASLAELHDAVTTSRTAGSGELILLKCTSAYPTPVEECNLATTPCICSSCSNARSACPIIRSASASQRPALPWEPSSLRSTSPCRGQRAAWTPHSRWSRRS